MKLSNINPNMTPFLAGAMTAPITYSFMWLCIFGGAGIKTERTAAGAGLCCHTWDHGVLAWNDTEVGNLTERERVRARRPCMSLNNM